MSKHVLMVVNTHVYDDVRVMKEAHTLAEAGYSVRIIGASRREGVETARRQAGISITLAPVVAKWHDIAKGLWQWLRGDVGQSGTSLKRSTLLSLFFFNLWVIRLGWRDNVDIIHCHDFSPYPTAWLLAKLKRAKLVYDSHENAPSLYSGRKAQVIEWIERRLLPRTDAVITVGERLARALEARGAKQAVVVGNWKDAGDYVFTSEALATERNNLKLDRYALTIAYFGTLTPERDILPLLGAVAQTPDIALLIGGAGSLTETVAEAAKDAPNIHWMGWADMEKVPFYEALSDIIYYCLNPSLSRQFAFSQLNKLFAAFIVGKALTARNNGGEMADILTANGAGILLEDVTPETLKGAFAQLKDPATLARLQANAHQAAKTYNWDVAKDRLLAAYEELTAR